MRSLMLEIKFWSSCNPIDNTPWLKEEPGTKFEILWCVLNYKQDWQGFLQISVINEF